MDKIFVPRLEEERSLGAIGYPDLKVRLWTNPSQRILEALAKSEGLPDDFCAAVSLVILDHNLSGIDFGTAEGIREAAQVLDPDLFWGMLMELYKAREERQASLKERNSPSLLS